MKPRASGILNLVRRHTSKCPHREKGCNYIKCSCPILIDGYIDHKRIRRSAGRDWQRALRKLAALESPDAPALKPVCEAIDGFLAHCRDLAPSTLRKYSNVMRLLRDFLQPQAIDTMAEITVEVLDQFRGSRKLAGTTSTKELQTLRQFFGFCVQRKWSAENPARQIDLPRNVRPEEVEPYTPTEVSKILAASAEIGRTSYERLRARAMVMLLRFCGLRISDVAIFARDRIRDGSILLRTLKTGGVVLLPVPDELQAALDCLPVSRGAPADCPYFFWNGIMSRRAAVGIAERTLAAVFKRSRVAKARAHRFRHTLATEVLVKGGTEQDVADILGISPAIVRKHYAKWTPARQERISMLLKQVHLGTFWTQTEKGAVIQ